MAEARITEFFGETQTDGRSVRIREGVLDSSGLGSCMPREAWRLPSPQPLHFVQTCVEEVENAEYVAPLKPLLSMRVEDPVDEELDPRSRLRDYVDSKRRFFGEKARLR